MASEQNNPYVRIQDLKHRLVNKDNNYFVELTSDNTDTKAKIDDALTENGYNDGLIPYDQFGDFAVNSGSIYDPVLTYYENKDNYNRHVEAANLETRLSQQQSQSLSSATVPKKPESTEQQSNEEKQGVINTKDMDKTTGKEDSGGGNGSEVKDQAITAKSKEEQGKDTSQDQGQAQGQGNGQNQGSPSNDNSADNKTYYVNQNDIKESLSDGDEPSKYTKVIGNSGYTTYLQNNYPTEMGKAFAKSEAGSNYLKQLEPAKQKETTDTVSGMLSDPQKSYDTEPDGKITDGHYKIALDDKSVKAVDPSKLDSKEKETLGELEKAGIAKKYTSTETSNGGSAGDNKEGTPNEELKKSDRGVSELTQDDLKDYKDSSTKEGKLIIADKEVPYIKVNGYNKIRFPEVDKGKYAIPIMGLPPTRIRKDEQTPLVSKNAFDLVPPGYENLLPEMYIYDEDEQLKRSFLKLNITPLDVEFVNGVNGKVRSKEDKQKMLDTNKSVALNVNYNFAVQAIGNLNFNHSNTYNASSSEKWLGGLFETVSGISRELGGLTNVTGGYFGSGGKALSGFSHKLVGNAEQGLDEMLKSLQGDPNDKTSIYNTNSDARSFVDTLSKVGKTTLNNLTGARLDIPDVWVDSSTNVQHQFKIDLRTLNPDPQSDQYFKDIILPLYILLTLSLPTEADGISYKTPPYIKCTLDQFVKIKLGAITNISWNIPLNEVNFRRAPRHVEVNLTIRDLYSVMKQEAYDINNKRMVDDKTENQDITTKKEFVENFIRYSKETGGSSKPTTNEPYYLTEFARIPAYLQALEDYKKEQQKKNEEAQKKSSENATPNDKKDQKKLTADTSKTAQAAKEGAEKTAQLKNGNFITSINNVITGVTKGVKNVIAGTQKSIPFVRNLINTGKMAMNTANGLKSAVKLVGQTANLDSILNGQFASSVGFAFSNIANATDVVQKISDGCIGGTGLKAIVNAVGEIPQAELSNNIANCVTNNGTINLSDQIRNSACSMYALANMFGSTYANVVGLKNLGKSGGDIFDKAQSLFDNLGGIVNGLDAFTTGQSVGNTSTGIYADPVMEKYVSAMTKGMIDKGITTANQISSNATLQTDIQETSQVAVAELQKSITGKIEQDYNAAYESAKQKYGEGTKAKTAALTQTIIDQLPQEQVKATEQRLTQSYNAYLAQYNGDEAKARQMAVTDLLQYRISELTPEQRKVFDAGVKAGANASNISEAINAGINAAKKAGGN